jgi:hypothetical protein
MKKATGAIVVLAAAFLPGASCFLNCHLSSSSQARKHAARIPNNPCNLVIAKEKEAIPFGRSISSLSMANSKEENSLSTTNWTNFGLFAGVSVLYWYLMVFGAAAKVNGLPVPDFIPMDIPGWPATQEDLQPVIDDSYHFFYLSELLHNKDAPYVIPPRLAVFNFVEAWIFALLPVLWKDPKRLPRPLLLGSWLILGINLTNAFMAPYLAITEFRREPSSEEASIPKNRVFSSAFGGTAAAVAGYALFQSVVVATGADWTEFWELAANDRSYFAFCLDPIVLAIFQPFLLARVKKNESSLEPLDYVPFVGLIAWLFRGDEE